MKKIFDDIKSISKKHGASRVLLFGSRARGDNTDRSDIDIAVFSLPPENQGKFTEDIENIPTLFDFDIIFVDEKTDRNLLDNILKDGVVIMSKFDEKTQKLCEAFNRLEEAVSEYEKYALTSVRDGVIQRFEFCVELAWKSAREYLYEQGFVDLNSPKEVMKTAFSSGIIDDGDVWVNILNSRNLTSHVYDEATANKIFDDIKNVYLNEFKKLISVLKK